MGNSLLHVTSTWLYDCPRLIDVILSFLREVCNELVVSIECPIEIEASKLLVGEETKAFGGFDYFRAWRACQVAHQTGASTATVHLAIMHATGLICNLLFFGKPILALKKFGRNGKVRSVVNAIACLWHAQIHGEP